MGLMSRKSTLPTGNEPLAIRFFDPRFLRRLSPSRDPAAIIARSGFSFHDLPPGADYSKSPAHFSTENTCSYAHFSDGGLRE